MFHIGEGVPALRGTNGQLRQGAALSESGAGTGLRLTDSLATQMAKELTKLQASISSQILGVANEIGDVMDARQASQKIIDDAKEGVTKEDLAVDDKHAALIDKAVVMAIRGKWSVDDIKAAFAAARNQPMSQPGSNEPRPMDHAVVKKRNQLLSQMATCCHPGVRDNYGALVKASQEALKAKNKNVLAYRDRIGKLTYGIAVHMKNEAAENPFTITSVKDVELFAVQHTTKDPVDMLTAQLKAAAKIVTEIKAEYPHPKLQEVLDLFAEPAFLTELLASKPAPATPPRTRAKP